jgi:leucyl/phenylalanyl-tRNA--protein transferase
MPVYLLTENLVFPPVDRAEPDGILAVGGDLSSARLLLAYRSGIFPWYSEGEPMLWWSPDPRFVLFPDRLRISHSMRQAINSGRFRATFDQDFRSVIAHCRKSPRKGQDGTWITAEMLAAYCRLHAEGYAHSVEVWSGTELVGGLYGVSLGRCFFGESMFTRQSNASKYALVAPVEALTARGLTMIDCQVHTPHLQSLGAEEIPRAGFIRHLRNALRAETLRGSWSRSSGSSAV